MPFILPGTKDTGCKKKYFASLQQVVPSSWADLSAESVQRQSTQGRCGGMIRDDADKSLHDLRSIAFKKKFIIIFYFMF